MVNQEIEDLIDKHVDAKARDLYTWQKVRYQGGRVYYEATQLSNELSSYPIDIQVLYLEIT